MTLRSVIIRCLMVAFIWPSVVYGQSTLRIDSVRTRAAQAAASFSGTVSVSGTGEPLTGAHVFLANTGMGAAADVDGWYHVENVPPGPYEVVASMLGFHSEMVYVNIESDDRKRIDFQLRPITYQLEGVEVAAKRPRGWERDLNQFVEHLVGTSPNAKETTFVNPYVLNFTKMGGVFEAESQEPLILQNDALGYRLRFILDEFSLDEGKGILRYAGKPFFEEIPPKDGEQAAKWQSAREIAYRGSLQHLLWALINRRASEEGFVVRLDDRIDAPRSREAAALSPVAESNLVRSTGIPDVYELVFRGYLHVTYEGRDEGSFLRGRRSGNGRQVSWIKMAVPGGRIFKDGSVFPPSPLQVSGSMTTRRLADRVPTDFIRLLQDRESDESSGIMTVGSETLQESGFPQDPAWVYPEANSALRPVTAAIKEGDWKVAFDRVSAILNRNPEDLEARYYRAIVHREIAKYRTLTEFVHWKGGVDDFEFIIARDSAYRDVLYQYALYCRIPASKTDLRQLNVSYVDALQLAHAQTRLRPDISDLEFRLFDLYRRYIRHSRSESALAWFRKHPSDWSQFFESEILRSKGHLEPADSVLESMLMRPLEIPKQPILLARARIYYELDRPEEAEFYIMRAINEIDRPLHAAFVLEDVKYILSVEELAAYKALRSPDEFVAFFHSFWTRRDPLPARRVNLRLAEHYRRLLVAERDYAYDGYRLWLNNPDKAGILDFPLTYALNGEFNDKGLLYIRLGEPSERIVTVSGDPSTMKTSLGMTGERAVFAPKDLSYRANWTPNESWRYRGLGLDFHFVVDEGGTGDNWRLVPYLTNLEMLRDRMEWGGPYVRMARAAAQADEFSLDPLSTPPSHDRGFEPASQSSWETLDVLEGSHEMADSSREYVAKGLTMDRHTWPESVIEMPFPYLTAAFRDDSGLTELHLFYGIPTGQLAKELGKDSLEVEVGVSVHDSIWNEVLSDARVLQLPASASTTTASVQRIEFVAPSGNYHMAVHATPLGTRLLGGYKFERHLPDFSSPNLALSDVLPASRIDILTPGNPKNRDDVNVMVNPFRQFVRHLPIHIYFEIYNLTFGVDDLTHYTVTATLRPQAERRGILSLLRREKEVAVSVKMNETGSSRSTIEYLEIDAGSVPPGGYTLDVVVWDNITNSKVSRTATIVLVE